jgi:hypothetical protein
LELRQSRSNRRSAAQRKFLEWWIKAISEFSHSEKFCARSENFWNCEVWFSLNLKKSGSGFWFSFFLGFFSSQSNRSFPHVTCSLAVWILDSSRENRHENPKISTRREAFCPLHSVLKIFGIYQQKRLKLTAIRSAAQQKQLKLTAFCSPHRISRQL